MKSVLKYFVIFISALSLCRCANVVTPNGGPKDNVPPVVVETSPLNNSTCFNGKSISITFDEYITLNNPSDNILISPPLATKPDFQINRKTLIIKIKEPLKEETTYSINFGEAIKDLHEGNVFKGIDYVFSTGSLIDTQPDYLAKTNSDGHYQLSGLADNQYLLFAFKDGNSNLIYDLPNEEIGFYPELVRPYSVDNKIVLNDSVDSLNVNTHPVFNEAPRFEIRSFIQEDSIQKLFKKELVKDGLLRFVFRYPADNVSVSVIEPLPDTFNIIPVFSERKDTLSWYFTPNKDSLWVSINYDTLINDTTHFCLVPRKSVSKKIKAKDEVTKSLMVNNNIQGGKLKPEQPLMLSFSEPITRVCTRDILFVADKDTVTLEFPLKPADDYGCKFRLDRPLEPEGEYSVVVPDSVFFGLNLLTNDTIRLKFKVGELSQYGNIFVPLELEDGVRQVIVELITEKDKVVDKQIVNESEKVAFLYLEPGKYKLKATIDADLNGVWSPGNLDKGLQPEKVILYDDVFEIRANWDIDLDETWKIK